MIVCKQVLYSGRVQGVGFRYTCRGLVQDFPVAGYVRNLPDGRVELVAEGEEEVVRGLLAAIERDMGGYVSGRSEKDVPLQEFKGFSIRH